MLPWVITVIVILVGIILLEISSNENSGLKKKIRSLKQQVGRFKRGNMILKKKGGLTRKK